MKNDFFWFYKTVIINNLLNKTFHNSFFYSGIMFLTFGSGYLKYCCHGYIFLSSGTIYP